MCHRQLERLHGVTPGAPGELPCGGDEGVRLLGVVGLRGHDDSRRIEVVEELLLVYFAHESGLEGAVGEDACLDPQEKQEGKQRHDAER